jgi:FkbM family methyltransferase
MKSVEIKSWLKLCNNVGFVQGSLLFSKLKRQSVENLTVPKMPVKFSLRPNTSDIPNFYQIFIGNEYEINLPFEPKSIIDGGANIGLATIYLKSKFPDAKVVCVEPDEDNFQALTNNVKDLEDVISLKGGLWHSKTRLSISDKHESGKWGMIVEEPKDGDKNETLTETFTIDEIMEIAGLEQIDLLKLDIETAERELFSKNFQSWLPKTKAIIIELHDWITPGCSKPFFNAINESFNTYTYSSKGENTIIINEDLM